MALRELHMACFLDGLVLSIALKRHIFCLLFAQLEVSGWDCVVTSGIKRLAILLALRCSRSS